MNECSTHLKYINYPRPDISARFRAPDDVFEWVRRVIERRHRKNPDRPNVKFFDLEGFRDKSIDPVNVRSFYELVTTCSTHNVKLQNVDAEWIEEMMKLETPDRGLHGEKISGCVVSIKHLTRTLFLLELPHLEKIEIDRTSCCSMPEGDFERQPWSNLKQLKLWVDSERLDVHGDGEGERVARLLGFFFHGIRRENLESLRLDFSLSSPYINMTSVCSSCPNLKKLYLWKWPGNNQEISNLWGNLRLLEDVTFEYCENLGDAAFIGDDVTRPVILKATRLKSLTFKYLEEMPGVTDVLFQSALHHMPLNSLHLETDEPVSSITLAGLESLLTGEFAETIEKFSLKGEIKLEGVTDEQLVELEGKFRSACL